MWFPCLDALVEKSYIQFMSLANAVIGSKLLELFRNGARS